jgi:hypothetical protein
VVSGEPVQTSVPKDGAFGAYALNNATVHTGLRRLRENGTAVIRAPGRRRQSHSSADAVSERNEGVRLDAGAQHVNDLFGFIADIGEADGAAPRG